MSKETLELTNNRTKDKLAREFLIGLKVESFEPKLRNRIQRDYSCKISIRTASRETYYNGSGGMPTPEHVAKRISSKAYHLYGDGNITCQTGVGGHEYSIKQFKPLLDENNLQPCPML